MGASMAQVILKLGNDVSTDIIYPGRFMATVLPSETPQYAFADLADFNTKLKAGQVPPGSIIVGGKNFGCGSSREQAVSTLRGHQLVVLARSFARIFLQNAVNIGLRLVEVPQLEAEEGNEIEIRQGAVVNRTTGKTFAVTAFPNARQAIIDAGGLIPYTKQRLLETVH